MIVHWTKLSESDERIFINKEFYVGFTLDTSKGTNVDCLGFPADLALAASLIETAVKQPDILRQQAAANVDLKMYWKRQNTSQTSERQLEQGKIL